MKDLQNPSSMKTIKMVSQARQGLVINNYNFNQHNNKVLEIRKSWSCSLS